MRDHAFLRPGKTNMTKSLKILLAAMSMSLASPLHAQENEDRQNWPVYDAGPAPRVSLPKTQPRPRMNELRRPEAISEQASRPSASNDKRTGEITTPPEKASVSPANRGSATSSRPEATERIKTTDHLRPGQTITGVVNAQYGPSLKVGRHAFRLSGVEIPDQSTSCFTGKGLSWNCGRYVNNRLSDLIIGRKAVCTVSSGHETGAIGHCSIRGVSDIGLLALSEGLAVPNRHSDSRYIRAALRAKENKTGLWAGRFDPFWK